MEEELGQEMMKGAGWGRSEELDGFEEKGEEEEEKEEVEDFDFEDPDDESKIQQQYGQYRAILFMIQHKLPQQNHYMYSGTSNLVTFLKMLHLCDFPFLWDSRKIDIYMDVMSYQC